MRPRVKMKPDFKFKTQSILNLEKNVITSLILFHCEGIGPINTICAQSKFKLREMGLIDVFHNTNI